MGITAQFVCAKEILDMHPELEQHLLHRLTLTLVLPPFLPLPVQVESLTNLRLPSRHLKSMRHRRMESDNNQSFPMALHIVLSH